MTLMVHYVRVEKRQNNAILSEAQRKCCFNKTVTKISLLRNQARAGFNFDSAFFEIKEFAITTNK